MAPRSVAPRTGVVPTVPVWKLTRTRPARRLYDTLVAAGLHVSVLDQFSHDLAGAPPAVGPLPEPVAVETARAADRPARWGFSDPALEDDHLLLAAVADGDVVGRALLSTGGPVHVAELDRTLAFDGGYLWGLVVDPDWRRRGIASVLLETALARLHRDGTAALHALVAPDNHPSLALFRGHGFAPERRHVYVNALGLAYRSSGSDAGEGSPGEY